jgi:hypothetical protein
MTTAGPPDSQPGEESDGIRYFDFPKSVEPDEPSGIDPFESEDPLVRQVPKEERRPKLVAVRGHRTPKPPEQAPARDAFEFALEELPTFRSPDAETERLEATFAPLTTYVAREGGDAPQRARFVSAFNTARARLQQPFVAVAIRMPEHHPVSTWFPLVEQGIRSTLRSDDVPLVDRERFRLVAVLPDRTPDDVRPMLAALMAYLREHTDNAAEVGQHISVFTAPEGRPFRDGTSFLAEVYDKP